MPLVNRKAFGEWLLHLANLCGKPVSTNLLKSYWHELSQRIDDDETWEEVVRAVGSNWTPPSPRLPYVRELLQAQERTKRYRARRAARYIARMDLEGFNLEDPRVVRYVAASVNFEFGDSELGRAVQAVGLLPLLKGAVGVTLLAKQMHGIPPARQLGPGKPQEELL